jgi:ribokinase
MSAPTITVLGSVNLDLVANVDHLPVAGETVTGATLNQYPGGKGANQALAAKRLGADVSLVACVGNDANADEALTLLQEGGVNLEHCRRVDGEATGVALIPVSPDGENQIVVAPGANRALHADGLVVPTADALICQLEVPVDTIDAAAENFDGYVCINLAPARDVPESILERADLIVVNQTESDYYGELLHGGGAVVVTTLGAKGAMAQRGGRVVAESAAPTVDAIDAVGAGDTFTAALVVALLDGKAIQEALEFACVAGALATTKAGGQPSLPFLDDVLNYR